MKKLICLSAAFVAVLFVAGCATTGNSALGEMDQSQVSHTLTKGHTTTAQVRSQLGEPNKVSINSNGNLVWTYTYDKITPKGVSFIPIVSMFKRGTNDYHKELYLVFNKDTKRLKDYAFTSSTNETIVRGG